MAFTGKELLFIKEYLLQQLENKETLDDVKVAALKEAFEAASHDGPCPCESGRKFHECCKIDWIVLRDHGRRPVAEAIPPLVSVPTKGNGEDKDPGGGKQWFCRVGVMEDGGIVVEPLGQGATTPPIRMAEMLLTAYHVVNFNATIGTMQAIMANRRPVGPANRNAFGK